MRVSEEELHDLADAGCPVIQIEEPQIHLAAVRGIVDDVITLDFLVDVFVNLFEVTGTEQSVRDDLARRNPASTPPASADFRDDVVRWLDAALGPA